MELLVGGDAFWTRARADCAAARRRLLVQAMTFEGDRVGQVVAQAIEGSPAADRRVLVDGYTRMVVSDRWVAASWFNPALRGEVAATRAMFARLAARGVGVRVTNPVSPLLTNYPARNHKKLIVADDVAYIGGINFSDHNFAWRDFMLRLEGEAAADFLAADFAATWSGRPAAADAAFDDIALISLDGRTNRRFYDTMAERIGRARREVVVLSAYLTFPFTAPLAEAVRREVDVSLITPWANNKPLVRDYLLDFARRAGLQVRLLPAMSHLKGMLIDGTELIVGSCNFDFAGLAGEEELVAVIDEPALIADFRARIIAPALAAAMAETRGVSPLTGALAHAGLRIGDVVARLAGTSRRTAVDWR